MTSVVVKVFDLKTGAEEISRAISLNTKGRDWLSRTVYWAVKHGNIVQVYNVDDEALTGAEPLKDAPNGKPAA
jgi:hypothetical protein